MSLDEERLHVHARIFWLLKHGMFRTQCQLRDIFHWRTKFCQDHEDHVDVHRDRLLSVLIILLTRVAVTRVRVAVTRLQLAVS
jgi:hypothetical protein